MGARLMTDPRFQCLIELSRRMTSRLDLLTVTEDLVSCAIDATGAATAAIALWDRERDALITLTDIEVVELGSTTRSGEIYALLDDYPATRQVLADRRAISIHVDRAGDAPAEQSWLREYGLSASLVLPLVSRGESIGTMEIARLGDAFSEDDLTYCQLLCDMAGSAVENAKLHGELESTVAQYQSLIERLPAVTYLDDLDTGETKFVSPQIVELFGITPKEWMASPDAWLRTVHPDDRDRAHEAFVAAKEARKPFRAEYRVLSADGVVRWVVDQQVILPQVDGRPALTQGLISDISERKRAEQEVAHRANHDPLTGLPNRDQFRSRLHDAITHAQGGRRSLAVLYVDLDDFKVVNDGFGHEAGDELLAAIAERLRGASRAGDIVGRDGGDEFLVLMADLPGSRPQATRAAEDAGARVRRALQQPLSVGGVELDIRASVGISLFPFDAADAQTLLQHADAAMYQAKAAGRDASSVYQPGARDAHGQLELAARLRRAITADELTLHYQPIVELRSGGVRGVEALVRWNDPIRGLIAPDEFIPLAERTGLIRPISEWVISEASRQAAAWRAAGYDHSISINVPPDTCQQIGAAAIGRLIKAAGGEPSRITLEMTESAMMTPQRGQTDEMEALRALGIRLAIDDFGTGHSSLARLGELPLSILKIDRSFVQGLPEVDTARTLVTAIMYLAQGFGLEVIAEGVETEAQRHFLLEAGCRFAQGYLFSPPVEPAKFTSAWPPRAPTRKWADSGRGADRALVAMTAAS
ncbi:MAG TPA: EAL domain-containing protein [Thermoleophilaceae bacterium]|nr:EAL domain-containing protein [Thermoleophilaceae bacterium]